MTNAATLLLDDADSIPTLVPPPGDDARSVPPPPESGTRITSTALSYEMLWRAAQGELGERDRQIEALKLSLIEVEAAFREVFQKSGDPMHDVLANVLRLAVEGVSQ